MYAPCISCASDGKRAIAAFSNADTPPEIISVNSELIGPHIWPSGIGNPAFADCAFVVIFPPVTSLYCLSTFCLWLLNQFLTCSGDTSCGGCDSGGKVVMV